LSYYFCSAYDGGSTSLPAPDPPNPPPYTPIIYASPYNPSQPLGSAVQIDSHTGIITGNAPSSGIYVVTVCVNEYRNGILIATQRKDLQIKVADCQIAKATLQQPQVVNCKDFTMTFQNLTPSPLINSYFWDFGVPFLTDDTSNLASPSYTYPDTGTYVVKLVTNRNGECSDSTTTLAKVYPGFTAGFSFNGICVIKPTTFVDNTTAAYGTVNSWNWNFGDGGTSTVQNPQHTYSSIGSKNVTLVVKSTKGCADTISRIVDIIDKPVITMGFRDTLICIPDQLQLNASGQGVFSWTPLTRITNANTGTPTVDPITTTTYVVKLDDSGCINTDSVRVRVVGSVSLQAKPDTTICGGDPAVLGAQTDGLTYSWTPTASLSDPTLLNPIATPATTTTYTLLTTIGSCSAMDNMTVKVVPYPGSDAGPDDTICYNTSEQLNGNIVGSSFSWSPTNSMVNANTLTPTVFPARTTAYVLTVYDILGCPKPGIDTILVTVMPKMHPFAGRDTTVIVGQPLQFNASGGVSYLWSPDTGLSAIDIPDPIGIYTNEIDLISYKVVVTNQAGCLDSAYVNVKVFKTGPSVFVPTAFTPNGDGLNDVIRPIAVGMQRIEYFSIYNRWGQLVFTTTINGEGWDGKIAGKNQGSGVFVWMVKAIDYLGKTYFRKGTVTLIR
jgi:gliding motility-associated-like protein